MDPCRTAPRGVRQTNSANSDHPSERQAGHFYQPKSLSGPAFLGRRNLASARLHELIRRYVPNYALLRQCFEPLSVALAGAWFFDEHSARSGRTYLNLVARLQP